MIITPFRYCEYRGNEAECSRFAVDVIEGMSFCEIHAQKIQVALDTGEVELIPASKVGDLKKKNAAL